MAIVALTLLSACSRIYLEAAAGGVPHGDTRELSVTYLIGDFGRPGAAFRDLVAGIRADASSLEGIGLRTDPMILELGDNLYEEGLPHDLDLPGAQEEVDKLRELAAAFAEVRLAGGQVPVVLIPGNHDYSDNALELTDNLGDISRWYFLEELAIEGAQAWTQVPGSADGFRDAAALFAHLEGDPAARVDFMAPAAVPHTDREIHIVAIDSELVLDLHEAGHDDLVAAYWGAFDNELAAAPEGTWLMVAAHHPPITYGKHGEPSLGNWVFGQGYPQFPKAWQKALVAAWPVGIALGIVVHPVAAALVAVPPVTTALVTGRKQDMGSAPYDAYSAALLERVGRYGVDVVLAGHDHNTQIIELGKIDDLEAGALVVITGAGSKVDPVRRGDGTVAFLADYSWVRMAQFANGLSFDIVDRQGERRYRYELSR